MGLSRFHQPVAEGSQARHSVHRDTAGPVQLAFPSRVLQPTLVDNVGMPETPPSLPIETNRRRSPDLETDAGMGTMDDSRPWSKQPRTRTVHRTADRAPGLLPKPALSSRMACGSLSPMSDAQYYLCECSEHYPNLAAKLSGLYPAGFRGRSGNHTTSDITEQAGARPGAFCPAPRAGPASLTRPIQDSSLLACLPSTRGSHDQDFGSRA